MDKLNTTDKEIEPDQLDAATQWNMTSSEETNKTNVADQPYYEDTQSHNHTAMILFAFCALCMLGVFLFGLQQKPKEATAQEKEVEAKVETALANLVDKEKQAKTQKLFNDAGEMVQAFYDYPSNQQVALDDLQKNPFLRFSLQENDNSGDEKAMNRKQLERKLQQLQLQSVVGGKCLISGKIFGVDQIVDDTFNIKLINEDNVVLISQGEEFVLRM